MSPYRLADIPSVTLDGDAEGRCLACDSAGPLRRVGLPGDPGPARATFFYAHCPQCGTLALIDQPDDMSPYYGTGYYSFGVRKTSGARRLVRIARNALTLFDATPLAPLTARFGANRSLLSLRPLFDGSLGRRHARADALLDVGCGDGQKLHELRDVGFSDLTGADPFMRAPVSRPGFVLMRAPLDAVERRFAVVAMHHAFEHVPDPAAFLADLARVLAPGGTLLVRIPLVGGFAWRKYGGEWAQADAPRHFTLFSREGFAALAARTGWRLVRTIDDSGALQFAGSRLRALGVDLHKSPGRLRSEFSRGERRRFARDAADLNRVGDGDQAAFYLTR